MGSESVELYLLDVVVTRLSKLFPDALITTGNNGGIMVELGSSYDTDGQEIDLTAIQAECAMRITRNGVVYATTLTRGSVTCSPPSLYARVETRVVTDSASSLPEDDANRLAGPVSMQLLSVVLGAGSMLVLVAGVSAVLWGM